jgi:hypothetical protein
VSGSLRKARRQVVRELAKKDRRRSHQKLAETRRRLAWRSYLTAMQSARAAVDEIRDEQRAAIVNQPEPCPICDQVGPCLPECLGSLDKTRAGNGGAS